MLNRKTPLKRTGFNRCAPMKPSKSGLTRTTTLKAKAAPKFKRRVKPATPEEQIYMGKAARLGCMLCIHLGLGETPAQIHHPRTGTGAGKRAPHLKSFPLCFEHHQGDTGIHGMGRKAFEREYGVTEDDLRTMTYSLLGMVQA